MSTSTPTRWSAWNKQQLLRELGELKTMLERAVAGAHASPQDPGVERISGQVEQPTSLDLLCEAFGLSPFERSVLLLCAGPELDSGFGPLIAQLNADSRRVSPTFALALGTLSGAHWSALSPAGPLRRWHFIEVVSADSFVGSPLRIDERVLHFLCGVNAPDERLRGLLTRVAAPGRLPPVQRRLSEQIAQSLTDESEARVTQLLGSSARDQHAVASAACDAIGLCVHVLRAGDIPVSPAERETLARIWEREAVLSRSALLVDTHDAHSADVERAAAFLGSLASVAFAAAAEPLAGLTAGSMRLQVPRPPASEQRDQWLEELGPDRAAMLNGDVEAITQQFQLDAASIHELAGRETAQWKSAPELWHACRVLTRGALDGLAQRIESLARWDDLVLPVEPHRALRELTAHVRQRFRVYEDWGFSARQTRGLGVAALFSGPSGTGKTLAAEVIANELQLDLFRIDLSAVVNKYIGETEKNLRRLFDAAESSGAILLFDEADALFGRRSEVRDSHDRFSNIEVGYLLQRIESYRGLAILTTNMKQSLDPAFLRRMRFVINFPFPDAALRERIWGRIFPSETPTEGIDAPKLAQLNVAGGHIRNIALGAAVLAADAHSPVLMQHLHRAARSECAKLDRPPADAELKGWVS